MSEYSYVCGVCECEFVCEYVREYVREYVSGCVTGSQCNL